MPAVFFEMGWVDGCADKACDGSLPEFQGIAIRFHDSNFPTAWESFP